MSSNKDAHIKTRKYNVGDVFKTNGYGDAQILCIHSSTQVDVKFLNSGNIKAVNAGDLIRGLVTDQRKFRVNNLCKVGDIFNTKRFGQIEVIDYIKSTEVLVKFLDSGFEKLTTASSVVKGALRDDSRMKYKSVLKVGSLHTTNNYGNVEVISLNSSNEVVVKFVDTGSITTLRPSDLLLGCVRDITSHKFKPKLRIDNRFCVYLHKDSDGVVRYVGNGNSDRPYVFKNRGEKWDSHFINNKPTVEIVAESLTKIAACELEVEYIEKFYDTVVNSIMVSQSTKCMEFEKFNSVFKYDPTTPSCIVRKSNTGEYKPAGFKTGPYYKASLDNSSYGTHRIVWLLHNGSISQDVVIDHIDGDSLNNKIENLRAVTTSFNCKNRLTKLPKSGFRNIINELKGGVLTAYRVVWSTAQHSGKNSKSFSFSNYRGDCKVALREAYLFREELISKGELLPRIKDGENTFESI